LAKGRLNIRKHKDQNISALVNTTFLFYTDQQQDKCVLCDSRFEAKHCPWCDCPINSLHWL